MPHGVRFIAYWHFFWSALSLAFGIAVVWTISVGVSATHADVLHRTADALAHAAKSRQWHSHDALLVYLMAANWLWIVAGGPFIGLRLIAKKPVGYWLCLLEAAVAIGAWIFAVVDPHFLAFQALPGSSVKLSLGLRVLQIALPALVLVYLLLPKVRRIYT